MSRRKQGSKNTLVFRIGRKLTGNPTKSDMHNTTWLGKTRTYKKKDTR